jgi:hypothetical protein
MGRRRRLIMGNGESFDLMDAGQRLIERIVKGCWILAVFGVMLSLIAMMVWLAFVLFIQFFPWSLLVIPVIGLSWLVGYGYDKLWELWEV